MELRVHGMHDGVVVLALVVTVNQQATYIVGYMTNHMEHIMSRVARPINTESMHDTVREFLHAAVRCLLSLACYSVAFARLFSTFPNNGVP